MKRFSHLCLGVILTALLFSTACNKVIIRDNETINKQEISSFWKFSKADEFNYLPAKVPGSIHTDLIENGKSSDPFFRNNAQNAQWIGQTDWKYKTTFFIDLQLKSKKNKILRFNGLDTYADVFLNGKQILTATNMFRIWDVNVTDLILPGQNTLEIKFKNIFEENLKKWENAPFRLMAFSNIDQADTMLAMYSRKAQFHYGWDWGPRLITAGIWKPIELITWDEFQLSDVQVITELLEDNKKAKITTIIETEGDFSQKTDVYITLDNKIVSISDISISRGKKKHRISFEINEPKLWWTNGLGKAYLYDLNIRVQSKSGMKATKSLKIGIREVELVTQPDSLGKSFFVKLNGVPVFMKGANHIPEENFLKRDTREKYEHVIQSAAQANMNMLRVWGGGIYESDIFFELCDKYGILVWQDMMFANAMYPGDQEFLKNVNAEIVDNVKRIRNHPSLAFYCGNNENETVWTKGGWKENYTPEQQAQYEADLKKLYYEVIPNAIKAADGTRSYISSSQTLGFDNRPNSDGDVHYSGILQEKALFDKYQINKSRFMSKFGFQSYPEFSTVRKYTFPVDRYLQSEVMLSHQFSAIGENQEKKNDNSLIQTYMGQHFKTPKDFKSYLYVSQLVQAYKMNVDLEASRKNKPITMGALYWQINDCWPTASRASIDYFGNWKAAHYAVRDVYKPILLVPERIDSLSTLNFYFVSDELENTKAVASFQIWHFKKGKVLDKKIEVEIPANTSTKLVSFKLDSLINLLPKSELVLVYELENDTKAAKRFHHFVEPKDLNLPKPDIEFKIEESGTNQVLVVTSDVFVKSFFLSTENGSVVFKDNYFDLLPGIPHRVPIVGKALSLDKIFSISLNESY